LLEFEEMLVLDEDLTAASVVVIVGRVDELGVLVEIGVCLDVVVVELAVDAVELLGFVVVWFKTNRLALESVLRGGKRSLTLSKLLASSNEIFFWSRASDPIITLAVVCRILFKEIRFRFFTMKFIIIL